VSFVDVPDDVSGEQITAALVALGIGHLENDTENGLILREVHLIPGGVEVVLLRIRAAIFSNEGSTITARIGHRREPRS
jgi:hypothetical protein